jgi:hypothetical protein
MFTSPASMNKGQLPSIHNKKTYVVTKIDEDSDYHQQIKTNFEDADKYLKISNSMVIGKMIRGPKVNEEMKVVPYSIVGPLSMYEDAILNKRSTAYKYSSKQSSNLPPLNRKEERQKKANFESVDDKQINTLFKEYENIRYLNNDKKNSFMKQVPGEISRNLKVQEKSIILKNIEDTKFDKLSKFLSNKLKKEEQDLLIHKTHLYRRKKEISDLIESKKSPAERFGLFNWGMSLRRGGKGIENKLRYSYINIGTDLNPTWVTVKEFPVRSVDLVRNPSETILNKNRSMDMSRNTYLKEVTMEGNIEIDEEENKKNLKVYIINKDRLMGMICFMKNRHL